MNFEIGRWHGLQGNINLTEPNESATPKKHAKKTQKISAIHKKFSDGSFGRMPRGDASVIKAPFSFSDDGNCPLVFDALDTAYNFGREGGSFDLRGACVAMKCLPGRSKKLVLFENELPLVEAMIEQVWPAGREFLDVLEKEGRLVLLCNSFINIQTDGAASHPPCLFEVENGTKEPLRIDGVNALLRSGVDLGLSPDDCRRCALANGRFKRTLGQIQLLADYARRQRSRLICTEYRQFTHLGLLDWSALKYLTLNRGTYWFPLRYVAVWNFDYAGSYRPANYRVSLSVDEQPETTEVDDYNALISFNLPESVFT